MVSYYYTPNQNKEYIGHVYMRISEDILPVTMRSFSSFMKSFCCFFILLDRTFTYKYLKHKDKNIPTLNSNNYHVAFAYYQQPNKQDINI